MKQGIHGKAPQGRIRCGANQLTNLKTNFTYCTLLLRVLTVLAEEDLLFPSFPRFTWVAFRAVEVLLPDSDRLATGELRFTDLESEALLTSDLLLTGAFRLTDLEPEDLLTSERVATDLDEFLFSFL